jgi:hypothetical protein
MQIKEVCTVLVKTSGNQMAYGVEVVTFAGLERWSDRFWSKTLYPPMDQSPSWLSFLL